ncbi:metal ABC transporter solute-binding protein, Zn/Mn family [Thermococcus camini]|uniref:ABC-type manganese/zinc transport system, periplasmic component n=1 Tax=Thermococcus camini TaxID=2016373 RepID=A0A7G2DAJ3_9EURY|nr:zinc ABC transporter substrate-binding protein [Thermococcus camini]CAD5244137.1 ABC-type manganese/zinc transport system, periplasmic component [Thermococcus camini]
MRARGLIITFILLTAAAGLIPFAGASSEKPLVVTSIAPIASIVQDAFGDSVEVVYLIPPGADPHEYQLTASQIELLRKADVIVTTGGHLPVEKKIAELIDEGTITGEALFLDDYKREGFRYLPEYWYNDKDNPHGVWLDPTNALAIARATEKALERVNPSGAGLYRSSYKDFESRVGTIVEAYRALVEDNKTAVIQMPPDEYAIEWLGIRAIASIKPEEEVPAIGIDELLGTAEGTDLVVYARDSPDQMKDAAKELAAKSGKPLAEITVFWSDRPYTEVLIENSAAILKALGGRPGETPPARRDDVGRYVALSLVVGIVLGVALGVILKK